MIHAAKRTPPVVPGTVVPPTWLPTGLARALAGTGQVAAAGPHWEQALRRYARLGVPEAEQVRIALATIR